MHAMSGFLLAAQLRKRHFPDSLARQSRSEDQGKLHDADLGFSSCNHLSLSEMNEMIRKIDLMRGSFPKPWHFKAKGAGKSPGMWIIVSSCSFYVLICLAPGIGKWTFSCHPCTEGCFLGGTNIPIKATSKTHGFVRMGCLQIYQILSSCSPSKLP